MAGTIKINKAKKREVVINTYEVIADMDGNPNCPAEFDESPHDDGELYFKADKDASPVEKDKVLILNFIHQKLHHAAERKVPILDDLKQGSDLEVYHRAKFDGVDLDVCVYWPPPSQGEGKACFAMVKFTSHNLSTQQGESGVISTNTAWDTEVKADAFTKKNSKLVTNYWAPRWKYVVNSLRNAAYYHYERNGVEKPWEPEAPAEVDGQNGDNGLQEEKEEQMSVYSGSTGRIIGPKGSKIQEIKKAANVKDIRMPAKSEDGARPKARELVELTIIGKPRAITKARELIQEVVDEWANAPRPNHQAGPVIDFTTEGDGAGDHNSDRGDDWSKDALAVGDNSWETGATGGGETEVASQDWAPASAGNW